MNPMLRGDTFEREGAYGVEAVMTVDGAVNKSFFLLALAVGTAAVVWRYPWAFMPLLVPAAIVGFILAIASSFKAHWTPVTGPLYAGCEGLVLGGLSMLFEKSYPGIVMQAVGLTFGTLFCMLFIYKTGIIRVTDKLRMGIVAATGAVALVYIADIVLGLFHHSVPFIHQSGIFGIGFSLVVVGIAAFNLLLDFDIIEQGARMGAPKVMEWYGAFALMVTLVWLYLEILRLLSKIKRD